MKRALAILAGVIVLTGCVGSTSREAFEADVRARGGGITGATMSEAVQLASAQVAVADPDTLEVLNLRADAVNRNVVVQARRGDQPDFLDVIVLRGDEILSVEPVQDADRLDLDALAIELADVPLADTSALIDRAILEFGDPDTVLTSFSVVRRAGEPAVVVEVESPRRSGEIVFDLDGDVIDDGSGS